MEARVFRAAAITAWAPIAWGSTYYVTRHYLPPGIPLLGATIRALPAGLILLALRPALPRGSWWWRSALISVLTVGGFFVLIYVAGQSLPSSVASTLMASSAAAILLFAWPLAGERPRARGVAGAATGLCGVVLLLQAGAQQLDPIGVLASLVAMGASSLGFVLTKRWKPPVPPMTFAGWQLTIAGVLLAPVAVAVEGTPPALTLVQVLAFGYVALPATAVAYSVWFYGFRHLPAATVGVIGLLNPLTGTLLGALLASERLTVAQVAGAVLILGGVIIDLPRHDTHLRPTTTRTPPPDPAACRSRAPS